MSVRMNTSCVFQNSMRQLRCQNTPASRCSVPARANGTDAGASGNQAVAEVEVMTPEDADKAMQIGIGSAAQLSVSLTLTQVRCRLGAIVAYHVSASAGPPRTIPTATPSIILLMR